ncbi:hypothetical protein TWF730_002008 [Orbilia blumenaviensis]|uniref:Uncharacterized protein n=1 Tax=Orbilia blumenaviensis TaxID=1796055 RepID=A0AAV9UCQ1_9PEZI
MGASRLYTTTGFPSKDPIELQRDNSYAMNVLIPDMDHDYPEAAKMSKYTLTQKRKIEVVDYICQYLKDKTIPETVPKAVQKFFKALAKISFLDKGNDR